MPRLLTSGAILAALLIVEASSLQVSASQQAAAYEDPVTLAWMARVDEADQRGGARSYRVYGTPAAITLIVSMANRTAAPLVLTPAMVSSHVDFRVTQDRAVPVSATWQREVFFPDRGFVIVEPEQSIQLAPGSGVEWRVKLHPTATRVFSAGACTVEMAMSPLIAFLGEGWRGVPDTTLSILFAAPASAAERAAAYRALERALSRKGLDADARRQLQLAVEADPTDLGALADLCTSYLGAKMYREAIACEERLMVVTSDKKKVSHLLALVYMAAGDEPNAVRVLREIGLSEAEISRTIDVLRGTSYKRP